MDKLMRWVAGLTLATAVLAVVGCDDTTASPARSAELDRAVSGYLNALAESYSTLDTKPLEEWAGPDEIATVRRIVRSLVVTSDRVEAKLRRCEMEQVAVFRGVNATVQTLEVWDVVRYDAFTGVEKGRIDGAVQEAVLQLRQVDGHWRVIGRKNIEDDATPAAGSEASG
jgi:hypothetical protein